MVPSTVTAVVVFLLLVTPGLVFELLWQRTRPRRDESTFVEVSRVVLTGVVFTGGAAVTLVVLEAAASGSAIDVVDLLRDGSQYVTEHPAHVLRSVVAVVVLAVLYGVAGHDLLTPASTRRIAHETAWHTAFSRMAAPGVRPYLSVQLKDGTTITGYSAAYSTEPDPAKRDLLLSAPLAIRSPGESEAHQLDVSWQVMAVSGAEISTIAAAYVGTARPAARPRRRWVSRHRWQVALVAAAVVVVVLLLGR
jgi:hypothetical protein